ncbi:MAG: hypothetical protein NZV14_05765 [Bryobacteraceae bacterium]|nr:hypothetical protein [Bryobacteraceae bacterium]MDW8377646.1 hypothetical protein [Bryobacterales bacterium]
MYRYWLMFVAGILPLFGQQRGMYGGGGAMYGGVPTGQMVGTINDPGFASRLGATVSGLPPISSGTSFQRGIFYTPPGGFGGRGGWQFPRGRMNTVVVPWGVPVFYGGGFFADTVPTQTIVRDASPPPSTPTVVINQYYAPETVRPQLKDYTDLPEPTEPQVERPKPPARVFPPSATSPAPQAKEAERESSPDRDRATITLLAFEDSTVIAALGYWVEEDVLHYVTKNFEKKTASVKSLDLPLTEQLNKERNVEFKLEGIRGR